MSVAADDCAWAKLAVPQAPADLRAWLDDVARLFRLNPCLELERFEPVRADAWQVRGRNDANGQAIDVCVTRKQAAPSSGLVLHYSTGIKRETRLAIEAYAGGSLLTLAEHYATPPEPEREQRLQEVDRSLLPWAAAVRTHLLRERRWGWLPGYAQGVRFWLSMPPRHRRVARLVVWTTVAEFFVFVGVLAVYLSAG